MILDAQLQFSSAQAITATAVSTNIIDLGSTVRDIAYGQPIFVMCVVGTAFTDTGSDSTITVTVETDDNAAFASATAVQTIGILPALSASGARLAAPLALDKILERYVRLNYTATGGSLTTGSITSYLTLEVPSTRTYADNITISG